MKQEDDKLISQYLLGELSDQEKERFEERFFCDGLFFQQVEAARDELIESYLRGSLAPHQRERFEDYFLASPSRRENVETTRALIQVANRAGAVDAPALASVVRPFRSKTTRSTLWLAAAAVMVIAAGAALIIQSIRLQRRIELIQGERAALEQGERELRQQLNEQEANEQQIAERLRAAEDERARLEQQLEAIKSGRPIGIDDSSMASLTLYPVLVRDESKVPILKIRPRTRLVRTRVSFDAPRYDAYEATLETVEGKRVWHGAGLKASGRVVTLSIPASQLGEVDYLLTLSGVPARRKGEEIGKYYFRVVKE